MTTQNNKRDSLDYSETSKSERTVASGNGSNNKPTSPTPTPPPALGKK